MTLVPRLDLQRAKWETGWMHRSEDNMNSVIGTNNSNYAQMMPANFLGTFPMPFITCKSRCVLRMRCSSAPITSNGMERKHEFWIMAADKCADAEVIGIRRVTQIFDAKVKFRTRSGMKVHPLMGVTCSDFNWFKTEALMNTTSNSIAMNMLSIWSRDILSFWYFGFNWNRLGMRELASVTTE